ncbi:MAG: GNAT family N-acetyltransferase [Firmicutes bacterium]|nr:GNAT family N-acetyltransferase [Bacillota bacterium]
MVVTIRLATVEDAAELARLNQEFNGGKLRAEEKVRARLAGNQELVAVAEAKGGLVGFACAQSFSSFCYEELQGEITELYVQPSARRQGVAKGLISLLETQLRERGVNEVKVLTGQDNHKAIGCYQSCGYQPDDELLLRKNLRD